MDLTLQGIINAFSVMPPWEILAVIFGISYILLAAKESLWTWLFAFLSTLIYTVLFWEGALVSSSLLNFYYMIMAVYGFMLWRGGGKQDELAIRSWSLKKNVTLIMIGLMLSIILGYLSSTYTEAKFAYLDTFVMVFSVLATWMLANKILENWIYWMVIDVAAIFLYWKSGYLATIILFSLYVILAFYAYLSWRKAFHEHKYL